jgi:hypothetical protein
MYSFEDKEMKLKLKQRERILGNSCWAKERLQVLKSYGIFLSSFMGMSTPKKPMRIKS